MKRPTLVLVLLVALAHPLAGHGADFVTDVPPADKTTAVVMRPAFLHTLILDLFVSIHALSGYPVPKTIPEVHSVPVEVMQQKLCGKPCAVKAFYHPQWGVYLDEKLDLQGNDFDRSVLLHELVHYMQNTTGRFEKMPGACERNHVSETEAYAIQNQYLASVGSPKRALQMGWATACRERDRKPEDGK